MTDKMITVCDKCLCACCWQGEFMCDLATGSGTVQVSREWLYKNNKVESPEYWLTNDELILPEYKQRQIKDKLLLKYKLND